MDVLLIDNFDSFVFNLVDEFRKRGARTRVFRNNISAEDALAEALKPVGPRLIVLSPGPGKPNDAGCCCNLVRLAKGRVPILGVCLGHQAITEAFGGTVEQAGEVVHGKAVWIQHNGKGLFSSLPRPLLVGRYHSLVATKLSEELEVIATYGSLIMAIQHRQEPIWGLQFHPESILTPHGGEMFNQVMVQATFWHEAREREM